MYTINEYRFAQSAQEALELVRRSSANRVIAGGTWLRMGKTRIHTAIDLSKLGLDRIERIDSEIRIGAMTALRAMERSPLLKERSGNLFAACLSGIVGTQFRNCATIGAGVYSAFGFSDPLCALLALDAEVELAGAGRMKLRDFLADKPKKDVLTYIYVKDAPVAASWQCLRQSATDFSLLNLCVVRDGNQYRVCVGARPNRAVRCPNAEEKLASGDINAALDAVMTLPYAANLRGSAEYRRQMSRVLLERALKEVQA